MFRALVQTVAKPTLLWRGSLTLLLWRGVFGLSKKKKCAPTSGWRLRGCTVGYGLKKKRESHRAGKSHRAARGTLGIRFE